MKDLRIIQLVIGDTIVSVGGDSRIHYVPEGSLLSHVDAEPEPVTGVEVACWSRSNPDKPWSTPQHFPNAEEGFGNEVAPVSLREFAEGLLKLLDSEGIQ